MFPIALGLLAASSAAPFHAMQPGEKYSWGWNAEAAAQRNYIEQPLDHFQPTNKTWMQAYYVNATFWAGADSNAPVFIYVGGEGPLSNHSVTSNFVLDVLPSFRGLMLGLEHRYYGCWNESSCPTNVSNPDMQYLSSHQALQDLAAFHDYAVKKFALSSKAPWILIGGSYPGMLAAFARAMFPSKFAMAVASSAPVHAKFDMNEYYDTASLAYSMDVEGVRGSPKCYNDIKKGHAEAKELLSTARGRARFAAVFNGTYVNVSALADPKYQLRLAGRGLANFPAQSNSPNCDRPACGITQICATMADETAGASPLERVAEVRRRQDTHMKTHVDEQKVGRRNTLDYWWYQTCTEFAFYQTCETGSKCMYSQGLDVEHPIVSPSGEYQNDFCASEYNISTEATKLFVRRSNEFYAPLVRQATRIIWPNGDVDPWHGLSHLTSPGKDQPTIFPVKGAHHCAWMSSEREYDQKSVKDARKEIFGIVRKWLAEMA